MKESIENTEQIERHISPILIRNHVTTHAWLVSMLADMGNDKGNKNRTRNGVRWFQEMRKFNPIPLVYIMNIKLIGIVVM